MIDSPDAPPPAPETLDARRLVALYEAAAATERARLALELARRGLHY